MVAPRLLAALAALLAVAIGMHELASVSNSAQSGAPSSPATGGPRYAVVLVLDGARPSYFNLAPMPNLHALMRSGTTYNQAFVGQELANTPPSHATIGTGMFPKHNGIEGFLWENPVTHQIQNPTESWAVEGGQLERVIAEHHVPTLAGRIKAAYPRARIMSVAGHKCYASDAMGTPASDYILCAFIYHNRWVAQAIGSHRPPPGAINNSHWDVKIPPRTAGYAAAVQQWSMGGENRWTTRYALWAFKRVHYPRVLMINLSETDVLGHFTTDVHVIRYLMREFDNLLGQIVTTYRQAGLLSRTDFVITADHGMTPIHSYVPYSLLSQSISLAGATPVYIEHDTAAAIGIVQDSKARAVASNILHLGGKKVDATLYKVFQHHHWQYRVAAAQPDVSPALSLAYRTLANTAAAASGPDILAILAPHVSARQIVVYGYSWKEGHLGPQWDDQHIPLVLSGPGIKHGQVSSYPARLVDIAPTVEYLLGARSTGQDGIVLANAVQHTSAHDLALQRTRAARLVPIVHVLEHRSGYR
jgi:Type I phosphodiesterase / nucleotide pyrophosphatase